MAEVEALQRSLIQSQNADGGWSYGTGDSWTEPTALSLLALEASAYRGVSAERGREWLLRQQQPDGGWSPCGQVKESTWVTSLAVLALADSDTRQQSAGSRWLVENVNRGATVLQTVVARLRHIPDYQGQGGSPWFPGTAPWVTPTAMTIITFKRFANRFAQAQFLKLALEGEQFLWSRRCSDQGWNHGGSSYRSENAYSYPETTGAALLALTETSAPSAASSLGRARILAQNPGSSEGLAWLTLALHKHGQPLPVNPQPKPEAFPCRNNRDVALRLLALSAASPTNKLIV